MSAKTFLKKYAGWLVTALFLYLVFAKINWAEFGHALTQITWYELLGLAALYLLGYPLRAIRSRILVPQLSFADALGGIFIGYGANNILPARLGEFVRAQVVGKGSGIRRTVILSSIIIERVVDGAAIVFLLFVGAHTLNLPPQVDKARYFGLALFSIALLGVFFVGVTAKTWELFLPKGKLGHILQGLIDGAALATRSFGTVFFTLLSSVVIWVTESLMFLYGFYVFGFDLNLIDAFFVIGLVNLGVLLPSSPGNLGVFQYFASTALKVCAVSEAAAAAYGITVHLAQYIPVTIIAFLYLPHFGFKSFFEIKTDDER